MKTHLITLLICTIPTGLWAQNAAYNNYDFIPGESVIFEDDLQGAQDGEFPPKWILLNGQAVVNKVNNEPVMIFNECSMGNSCRVEPRMKKELYLGEEFTIEFDFLIPTEEECLMLFFRDNQADEGKHVQFTWDAQVGTAYFEQEYKGVYPDGADQFTGKWHHVALAYKKGQMKIYLNQHRVLVIPQTGFEPKGVIWGACANTRIRNFKLAEGGGMNMLGKILTEGRFVSHAINFDVNKSTMKGESTGFLNELATWLQSNAAVKLEIAGHTDSDGDQTANQTLSQARADAVKSFLVKKGIDASRLKATGYGETKPLDTANTSEAKAKNRRVELVKM